LQGKRKADADELDAGLRTNAGFHLFNHAHCLFTLAITRVGQDETEADGVIGVEAGVYILQTDETANQEPGADHQHH
jgi:hypothetical protein